MKKLLLGLLAVGSMSAFAGKISATCTQADGQKDNPWFIGSEEEGAQFKLTLSESDFTTDFDDYKRKVTGTFVKVTDSVRQLGDSEGSWWLNQNFDCTPNL